MSAMPVKGRRDHFTIFKSTIQNTLLGQPVRTPGLIKFPTSIGILHLVEQGRHRRRMPPSIPGSQKQAG